jgi:hypothetical protein
MEANQSREPWNKGKLIGQKTPVKPKDIWATQLGQRRHSEKNLGLSQVIPGLCRSADARGAIETAR